MASSLPRKVWRIDAKKGTGEYRYIASHIYNVIQCRPLCANGSCFLPLIRCWLPGGWRWGRQVWWSPAVFQCYCRSHLMQLEFDILNYFQSLHSTKNTANVKAKKCPGGDVTKDCHLLSFNLLKEHIIQTDDVSGWHFMPSSNYCRDEWINNSGVCFLIEWSGWSSSVRFH